MSQKAGTTTIDLVSLSRAHRIIGDRKSEQRAVVVTQFSPGDIILIDVSSVDFGAIGRLFVRSAQHAARLSRDGNIADANLSHAGVYIGDGRVVDLVPSKNVRIIEIGEFLARATRAVIVRHRQVKFDMANLLAASNRWYGSIRYVSLPRLAGASAIRLYRSDFVFSETNDDGHVSAVSICTRFSVLLLTTAHQNSANFDPHAALPVASANVHFVSDFVRPEYLKDNKLKRIEVSFLQLNRPEPTPPSPQPV